MFPRLPVILTLALIGGGVLSADDARAQVRAVPARRGAVRAARTARLRPPYARWAYLESHRRRYGYGYGYGGGYWGVAPSVKYKYHRLPVYETPRLGLQYLYPDADRYGDPIGLQLRPDPEEPLIPGSTDPFLPDLPPDRLGMGLDLFKQGRFAEAGAVLSEEIKEEVATLETYLVIAELLAANDKFDSAARVLLHGLSEAPPLGALDGVRIANHFPSANHFSASMTKLGQAIEKPSNSAESLARLRFLQATFRLLSGQAKAGMAALEELQDQQLVGPAARRLYLHFIDTLLEPEKKLEPGGDARPQPLPKPPIQGEPGGDGGDEV